MCRWPLLLLRPFCLQPVLATEDASMHGDSPPTVHESSYIDDDVVIGPDTRIWHFCHVLTGSRIGQRCRIGQNVVIGPRVNLGDNVKIQNNVSVYEGVTLEDDVFCGRYMVRPRSERVLQVPQPRC